MDYSNVQQGTAEWHQARIGKITASKLNDALATIKSGEAASRRNYKMQLVVETLTGQKTETYCNAAMQWGTDNEPYARQSYEFIKGVDVVQIGFVDHPEITGFGCSPDGLVGEDGIIEIKCPNTANHVEWMLSGVVPSEHYNQIQGQLECTGRVWADFISYDPRMPVNLQLFVVRVDKDPARIETIKAGVVALRAEIDGLVNRLRELDR